MEGEEGMEEMGLEGELPPPEGGAPPPEGELPGTGTAAGGGEQGGATGESSSLIAAPARREDKEGYLTPGAKGKVYHARKDDTRLTNKAGPTTRKLRPRPKRGKRDVFPGHQLLNVNALYEELKPTYNNDEDEIRLLENTVSVRSLIRELESKESEIKKSDS
jgi:hypothetical protein